MAQKPTRIGSFTVDEEIGRGGMGVVYAGHDTRLNRPVAIKAISTGLAMSADRMARFEREARTLAAVNHPNIAAVYGLEEQAGERYLVMELVQGETLAERLLRGALPVQEALHVCGQIASGVEAAHEAGVIHRDLKPGNVVITDNGKVKVLDFGLAREIEAESVGRPSSSDATVRVANNPVTVAGMVVGTPGYMSPEQARGKRVDKRTDIFSFGCLLYECLVGRTVFPGETATDVIAAILEREPDWKALPIQTPPRIRELVSECLVKDQHHRLRDIGDARIELERAIANREWASSTIMVAADMPIRQRKSAVPKVAAGVLIGLVLGAAFWEWIDDVLLRPAPEPKPVTRMTLELAQAANQDMVFLVPRDGRRIIFPGRDDNPTDGVDAPLMVRDLDSFESLPIRGTEGADRLVAVSPNGRFVLYWQWDGKQNELCRASLEGGPPVVIKKADDMLPVIWFSDDEILAIRQPDTLYLMTPSGTEIRELGKYRNADDNAALKLPIRFEPLPGGTHALMSSLMLTANEVTGMIEAIHLANGERTHLLHGSATVKYLPTGHIVFARGGDLLASPFDAKTLSLSSEIIPIATNLHTYFGFPSDLWTLTASGDLAYVPKFATMTERQLVTVDAETKRIEPLDARLRGFVGPFDISPDGQWVSASIVTRASIPEIWAFGIGTQRAVRLSEAGRVSLVSRWAPDSRTLAYVTWSPDMQSESIYIATLDAPGDVRMLYQPHGKERLEMKDWTPDGKHLLIQRQRDTIDTNTDLYLLPIGGGERIDLLATRANESNGVFSPDAKWLAYQSDASGQQEIYIRSFDSAALTLGNEAIPVSRTFGTSPMWIPDGKKILFNGGSDNHAILYDVALTLEPQVSVAQPKLLIDWKDSTFERLGGEVDFMPTKGQFVRVQYAAGENDPAELRIVLHWLEEFKRNIGTSR